MSAEQDLITKFYSSFQQCNWKGMLECYREEVFFYDPVFGSLEGPKAWAMWEMLLGKARDFSLSFNNVAGAGGYGSCEWVATYTFTPTGKKVTNKGKAHFFISDGKITEHQDDFNLWKWSAQALGWQGALFGWTAALRDGVRKKARHNLEKFMAARATSL